MNTLNDIVFRKSRMVDLYYGGGPISWKLVEDNTVNNVFSDVPADYPFWGGNRYRKIFLSKTTSSGTAKSVGVFIYRDSQAGDTLSLRAGTIDDKVEDARNYSGWHKIGTLLEPIVGMDSGSGRLYTRNFSVAVTEANSTGFYVNNRIYISDGRMYSILYLTNVVWISSTTARLYVSYDSDITFSIGARVSSICELGDIEPYNNFPLWIKQYIPEDIDVYYNSKPIIGFLGV